MPRPALVSKLALSLSGGVVPALVGMGATLMIGHIPEQGDRVLILLAWSAIGYLNLTDLGLTRSASKLATSNAGTSSEILQDLWHVGIPYGLIGMLLVLLAAIGSSDPTSIAALAPIPIIAALQFPAFGLLEASGDFGYIAFQRTASATTTYLAPALLGALAFDVRIGLLVISCSRAALLIAMCHRLRVPLLATLKGCLRERMGSRGSKGVVGWLALSSVLGPALLYIDRLALGWLGQNKDQWVFYTATSELMMKSYIIPAALTAVVFPWLARNIHSRSSSIKRGATTLAACGTAFAVGLGLLTWLAAPSILIRALGSPSGWESTGRAVLGLAVMGTLVNWVSQIYIALLQALDNQRFVGKLQAWTIGPFAVLVASAALIWGAPGVAAAALARVLATNLAMYWRGSHVLVRMPQPSNAALMDSPKPNDILEPQ